VTSPIALGPWRTDRDIRTVSLLRAVSKGVLRPASWTDCPANSLARRLRRRLADNGYGMAATIARASSADIGGPMTG
jgi:hypothetical protein